MLFRSVSQSRYTSPACDLYYKTDALPIDLSRTLVWKREPMDEFTYIIRFKISHRTLKFQGDVKIEWHTDPDTNERWRLADEDGYLQTDNGLKYHMDVFNKLVQYLVSAKNEPQTVMRDASDRLRTISNSLHVRIPEKEIPAYVCRAYEHSQIKDRKSTRLNSSHSGESRMPSSA